MNCIDCGFDYLASGRNQKRCGSVTNRIGCAFKRSMFLKVHNKDGTRRYIVQKGRRNTHSMQRILTGLPDNTRCALCGTGEKLTVDHIKPRCVGGTDETINLRVLCKACNMKQYHELVKTALRFYFEDKEKANSKKPI